MIVPASAKVPLRVTGNTGRLALRQSRSKVAKALLEKMGQPLVSTSANVTGAPTCAKGIDVFGIMDGLRYRRLQAVVASVSVETCKPGKLLRVIAEADLVVGLEEVACCHDQFAVAVPLEPCTWHHVEHAVCPVAEICTVAASLNLQRVDVFGVDLRPNIAGNICVRDEHAIDKPAQLMTAPHVQHVVGHIRARNVIRDHRQTISPVGPRGVRNVSPVD